VRRLLVLLPSLGFGGTERHTALLAQSLRARGMELRLAAEPSLLGQMRAAMAPGCAAALEAAPIGWDHAASAEANQARQHSATAALLKAHQPDLALVPLPWPDAAGGIFSALGAAAVPALAIAHLAPRELTPAMRASALHPAPDARVTRWAAVSAPVARRVEAIFGLPPRTARVVPNAVRPPSIPADERAALRARHRAGLGVPEGRPLILVVGRLDSVKGSDLLPAITDAMAQARGAIIACAGEGPMRPALEAAAAERPDGRLRLLGQVTEMTGLYLAADALLLPSRLEGHPLVFLEAAGLDCPVVASPAALEALPLEARGRAAMLARSGEAGSLVAALCALLADPARRARQVAAARSLATQYSEQDMLDAYARLVRAAFQAAGAEVAL
jgi:glycosyltransferase involved in cell wall biosynthesis